MLPLGKSVTPTLFFVCRTSRIRTCIAEHKAFIEKGLREAAPGSAKGKQEEPAEEQDASGDSGDKVENGEKKSKARRKPVEG